LWAKWWLLVIAAILGPLEFAGPPLLAEGLLPSLPSSIFASIDHSDDNSGILAQEADPASRNFPRLPPEAHPEPTRERHGDSTEVQPANEPGFSGNPPVSGDSLPDPNQAKEDVLGPWFGAPRSAGRSQGGEGKADSTGTQLLVGNGEKGTSREGATSGKGIPLSSGVVFLQGRFIPRPYVLSSNEQNLFINDELLLEIPSSPSELRLFGLEPDFFGGGFGLPMPPSPFFQPPSMGPNSIRPRRLMARLENRLRGECGIIRFGDGTVQVVTPGSSLDIAAVLASSASKEQKLSELMNLRIEGISSAQWQDFLSGFRLTPEFQQQLGPILEQRAEVRRQNLQTHKQFLQKERFRSSGFLYAVNLGAMMLIVAAFAVLITSQPRRWTGWRRVDLSPRACPIVGRTVLIVLLLSGFDLLCTLLLGPSGSMFELNPLAAYLVDKPVWLAFFKIVPLVVSCGILYLLRYYRGAQVAAWGLCLICTVLAIRWLTFNSLFLS